MSENFNVSTTNSSSFDVRNIYEGSSFSVTQPSFLLKQQRTEPEQYNFIVYPV